MAALCSLQSIIQGLLPKIVSREKLQLQRLVLYFFIEKKAQTKKTTLFSFWRLL
jgi:hypothetical protein